MSPTITSCVSTSAFTSLVSVSVGVMSSTVEIKISVIIEGIKKYKPIINKKKRKNDKIVLLGKYKLNTVQVLISKSLINSYISHDGFVIVNDILIECNKIKKFV